LKKNKLNFSYSSYHFLNKDKFKSLYLEKIKNDNYEKKIDINDYKSKDINKVKNSVFNNKINYCEIKKVKKDNFIQENISILRKYNELERNYSNLNNDYIEIQNELKNKNQLISDFQKLTENGKIKFKQIDNQNNEFRKIIQAYEKANNNLKELNKFQNEKIKEFEKQNYELNNQLKTFDILKNENQNIKNEIIILSKQIKILSQQLKDKEQNYLIEIKEKENKIKILIEKNNNDVNEKIIKISSLNEEIKKINLEKEILDKKFKEILDDNTQKNIIIKKLNDCILEYNQVIIQSQNELTDRDKSYENIEKEKEKLIKQISEITNEKSRLEEKNKIIIEENRIQNLIYEEKITEIIKENNDKNNEINKLNEIILDLQKDKNDIKNATINIEKSNIFLANLKEKQNELNVKVSSLTNIVCEKEKIIQKLKDKYDQKISIYKLKLSENKNRINNLMNNLIEMKSYVKELEQIFENRHIYPYSMKRYNSMEKINRSRFSSIELKNNLNSSSDNDYNSQLIDSSKSMIVKIDNKLNESNINEDEILKKL
jgi:hypothetical protein